MANDFHIEDGILKSYTGRDQSIIIPQGVHTIGEGAFKACVSLEQAILPPGLLCIMPGAFKGCRRLRKIEIPEGVSYIGDYAFHRCHALEEISLPLSVTDLGDCVFLYCDSLIQVKIPGVRCLGKQVFLNDVLLTTLEISRELSKDCICDVFTGCGKITTISFPDGEQISIPNSVEVIAGNMNVPPLVRAVAVDVLRMMELDGRCLVKFLTNLKHVEIPEGIEKIGKSCFFDKRGIISIQLPASLKVIESRAFRNCVSLERVSFLQEPEAIHEDAFKNCTSLKEIHTPNGKTYTFHGIPKPSEPIFPPIVETIHKQVLGNFRLSGNLLLKYLGNESRVTIPEGVTMIAEKAFAGNESIERVLLPEGLEEIGAGAFQNCLVLQTLDFPQTIKRIGAGAFENCVKLIRAILPETLTQIEPLAFKYCRALREISLGKHLKEIGEQAFYGCSSLKTILLPETLTTIGEMAFYRCSTLKEVTLLPSVEQIGNLAFAQSGVKKVRIMGSGNRYGTDLFSRCLRLKTMIMEHGVLHIPDKLAYHSTALTDVILPDSLESVGRHVWEDTPFLKQWLEHFSMTSQHADTSETVFWDGRNLTGNIMLPNHFRIVAGGAFYGNESLTEIHFPEHCTWIGPAALKGCSRLRHVSWPPGITNLEDEVFSGCLSLETVTLSDSSHQKPAEILSHKYSQDVLESETFVPWHTIGKRAFFHCKTLDRVMLNDVTVIGKESFSGCIRLCLEQTPSLLSVGERAFEDTCFLHNSFKCQAGNLSILNTIVISGHLCEGELQIPEGITEIAPFACSGNRKITKLILPSSLRRIGEGAFWGCSSLEEISSPHSSGITDKEPYLFKEPESSKNSNFPGLCQIDARAFEKCISLKEIIFHTAYAGKAAFSYCTSLKKAELYELSVLEERLFEGCSCLEQCICPDAQIIHNLCFSGCNNLKSFDFQFVKQIGSYSFQNCDSLRQVSFQDHTILNPHAFEDCGRLEQLWIKGNQGIITLREYALSGCTFLNQITIQGKEWQFSAYSDIVSDKFPEMVRLIFHSAFSCFEIDKEKILISYLGLGRMIKIPKGIERIEADVFRDVLMLETVDLPETVTEIGARAFHGTAWMEKRRSISPLVIVNHMLLDGSSCVGEVTVPEEIELVCGWAFANGMGIETIRFLSPKTRVAEYAFRNCIYLKELVLPDHSCIHLGGIEDQKKDLPPLAKQAVMDRLNCFKTNAQNVLVECTGNISNLLIASGITAIGDEVFQDGNLLTQVTFPSTVTSIGKSSFARCKWLKTVRQAQEVTSISDMAFSGCGALETIELSEKLQKIGIKAFENCTSLKEILLPEGLEEIPDKAFFRCHSLKHVILPSTLKRIGKEAFAFCKNLEKPRIPEGVVLKERAFL